LIRTIDRGGDPSSQQLLFECSDAGRARLSFVDPGKDKVASVQPVLVVILNLNTHRGFSLADASGGIGDRSGVNQA
jgi:hypothetical protein